MVDSAVFIGAIVIALTQVVKILAPKVSGVLTVVVAIVISVLISLLAHAIGVTSVSIASAILIGLAAVGVHTTASAVNTTPVSTR